MRRVLIILCLIAAIWPLSMLAIHLYRAASPPTVADGNASSAEARADARLTVVVSVAPHGWLVSKLAGQHARVLVAVPPGASPATYQPTDAQVSRIMAADVYFRTGVPFERGPWFKALHRHSDLRIVDLRDGVPMRVLEAHHHDEPDPAHDHEAHDHPSPAHAHDHHDHHHEPSPGVSPSGADPHIWTSPPLLKIQAATIATTLGELDPGRKRVYDDYLHQVGWELDGVDRVIRQRLASYVGKAFFVFHPSWGYFADTYGLRQIAIEIEGKDPSDRQLTELQSMARREGAKVIFVQPQNVGRGAQAVAEAIEGEVHTIDPLADNVPENLLDVAEAIERSFE
jgi:zinc transport system substrate-binding protein